MWAADGAAHATGSARRRRERRLRAYLKYARMSVAMALAEVNHHSAPRRPKTARARGWTRPEQIVDVPVLDVLVPRRLPPPQEVPATLVPMLAQQETSIDGKTLHFLIWRAFADRKEEQEVMDWTEPQHFSVATPRATALDVPVPVDAPVSPVVEYVSPAPVVCASFASRGVRLTRACSVCCLASCGVRLTRAAAAVVLLEPVVEYVSPAPLVLPAPVVEYVSPAPAVLPCATRGVRLTCACCVPCATRGVRLTRACSVALASRGVRLTRACSVVCANRGVTSHPRLKCCLRHSWSTSHPRLLLLRRPSHPRLWCPSAKVALKEWLRRRKKVKAELDALMDLFHPHSSPAAPFGGARG